MKKTLKYLIKLLFVIIIPLVVSISSIYLVITNSEYNSFINIVLFGMLTLLTVFNAVFCSVVLCNTNLLPSITFEIGPVIGFCIAYDRNVMRPTVIILLPFLKIEIRPRTK